MARKSKIVASDYNEFAAQRAKWDFSKPFLKTNGIDTDAMLMECWAYEFSRENAELVKAIGSWRASLIQNRTWKQSLKEAGSSKRRKLSFEELKHACAGSDLLRVESNNEGMGGCFIRIPFRAIYLFCPEWPEKAFLEIDLKERVRRTAAARAYSWHVKDPNWSKGLDDYPASLEADPKRLGLRRAAAWHSFTEELLKSARSRNKLRAFVEDEFVAAPPGAQYLDLKPEDCIYAKAECVMFRIPWKYEDKAIVSLLRKWLDDNRPASENPAKLSGRAKTGKTRLQNIAEHLEMLGKWRLVKRNRGDISTLHPVTDKPLFRDKWRWIQTNEAIVKERRQFDPIVTSAQSEAG
jgi:hypothetical protein